MIRNTEAVVRRRFSKQLFYKSRKFHRKCFLESLFNKNAGLFLRTPFFTEHLSTTASERSCKSVFDTYFFSFLVVYILRFLKEAWNHNVIYLYWIIGIEQFKFGLCDLVKRFYNNCVVNFMNLQIMEYILLILLSIILNFVQNIFHKFESIKFNRLSASVALIQKPVN